VDSEQEPHDVTEELQKEPLLFDKTALARALGVADASTLASFYEIYLQQARPLLEVLQPGAGLLGDRTLEKLAHKLKASSFTVGAQPRWELLARLEALCRQGDQDALADQIPNAHALAAQTFAAVEIFQISLAANAEKVQLQPD
jgi:HPt (histidine-containing phosphotransfer) domain-containing protein